MDMREELNIVEDDGNMIKYEEVKVKTDMVSRNEVADLENKIIQLEQEIQERNATLEDYKAKLEYAKTIIAKADAQKQAEAEAETISDVEVQNFQ